MIMESVKNEFHKGISDLRKLVDFFEVESRLLSGSAFFIYVFVASYLSIGVATLIYPVI